MKSFNKKFSLKREADILNSLSLYLSANLPLLDALVLIAQQAKKKKEKQTILRWCESVESGQPLDLIFSRSSIMVSRISISAAGLGERSGSLSVCLLEASRQIKNSLEIRKKIVSAVAYPSMVLGGTIVLVVSLLVFVFPKIIPLFETLKVSLPLSTRILIWLSHFLSHYWVFVITIPLGLVFASVCLSRFFERYRKAWQKIVLRVPFVGHIVKLKILSSIFNSLQVLIQGGEHLDGALTHISEYVNSHEYQKTLTKLSEDIREGKILSEAIVAHGFLFPHYVASILSVGERTANMEGSFKHISEIVKEDINNKLKILTVAIEPTLMISMSGLIGFIALSIILPIYGITSHFQHV